jgi:hypothetical protein
MQGLEVDFSSGNQSEIETSTNSLEKRESEAIEFSYKVVEFLKGKTEKHNLENERVVTLNQLKHVFKRGAGEGENSSKTIWALARVNMFLKMMRGDGIKSTKVQEVSAKTSLDGLIMEDYASSENSSQLDISNNFYPDEEDILQAEHERTHHLSNYNFRDLNDVYLETEEEIRAEASNWLDNIIN